MHTIIASTNTKIETDLIAAMEYAGIPASQIAVTLDRLKGDDILGAVKFLPEVAPPMAEQAAVLIKRLEVARLELNRALLAADDFRAEIRKDWSSREIARACDEAEKAKR